MELLTKNMARMMQTLEMTQKAVVALSLPKAATNPNQTEKDREVYWKDKTMTQWAFKW